MINRCKANPCCGEVPCSGVPLPQHGSGLAHLNKQSAPDLASENERLRAAIREAGLKARDEVVEGLSGDGSPDNDLADYLERIVDACANAITKEPTP